MTRSPDGGSNKWNPTTYDGSHSFVYEYGEEVVSLLDPQDDERVLDLGCGTGHLTDSIAGSGADVVGVDSAEPMVEEARATHPGHRFVHADARDLPFDDAFDAVFSNAALHWIPEQERVLGAVASALKPGGRFVAELGGTGNVGAIVDAVCSELERRGYEWNNPWFFPSVGEYAPMLESHGFEVRYAVLFDRPTELDGGEDGLANWLEMFGDGLLGAVPAEERGDVVAAVADELRPNHFDGGVWTADYRRLRFVAALTDD